LNKNAEVDLDEFLQVVYAYNNHLHNVTSHPVILWTKGICFIVINMYIMCTTSYINMYAYIHVYYEQCLNSVASVKTPE